MGEKTDSYKFRGRRNALADLLIAKGIRDEAVLNAIRTVPRHWFLDSVFEDHAYEDKAFPIGADQTISQPYTVAYQTELLALSAGDRVLEIGTGSGYQTAVLVAMGMKVFSIERQWSLFKKTQLFLRNTPYNPKKLIFGDGYQGLEEKAPYDGILVTAGAPEVPRKLLSQLKIGGRLVVPIGVDVQRMTVYTRVEDKKFQKDTLGTFRFVPMLGDRFQSGED